MIVARFIQECENPQEQVFFKHVELKESVICKDEEEMEIDFDTE